MKKIIFILTMLVALTACKNSQDEDNTDLTSNGSNASIDDTIALSDTSINVDFTYTLTKDMVYGDLELPLEKEDFEIHFFNDSMKRYEKGMLTATFTNNTDYPIINLRISYEHHDPSKMGGHVQFRGAILPGETSGSVLASIPKNFENGDLLVNNVNYFIYIDGDYYTISDGPSENEADVIYFQKAIKIDNNDQGIRSDKESLPEVRHDEISLDLEMSETDSDLLSNNATISVTNESNLYLDTVIVSHLTKDTGETIIFNLDDIEAGETKESERTEVKSGNMDPENIELNFVFLQCSL